LTVSPVNIDVPVSYQFTFTGTLRDQFGAPVAGYPAELVVLDFGECTKPSSRPSNLIPADGPSDVNGQVVWMAGLNFGGADSCAVRVLVDGVSFHVIPGFPTDPGGGVRSPDHSGDAVIHDCDDLGEYTHAFSRGPLWKGDFNRDDTMSLLDLAFWVWHFHVQDLSGLPPCPCVVVDNGAGVVNLPPEGCSYIGAISLHQIVDGLPPGTMIEIDVQHGSFSNIRRTPGGTLGGEIEEFDSMLFLDMQGTGELAGFSRSIEVPVACEVHTSSQAPGMQNQFTAEMMRLQGDFDGAFVQDPDFTSLELMAGTDFGLSSPGLSDRRQQPSTDHSLASFFSLEFQISFEGAPGGPLSGMSGTTTDNLLMAADEEQVTGIAVASSPAARSRIFGASPNPFNPQTTITFTLERPGRVDLLIYDVAGRLVKRLVDVRLGAGEYEVKWDGRDQFGNPLESGTYFFRLRQEGRLIGSDRAVLLK
jgi:hypothetical protein